MNKLTRTSRILIVLAAVFLAISIFTPLWRIDLDAPQYPEGLALLIYPNRLAGDVDIINGLNHYIGMNTLHTEDFVEFTILPYIIAFFAVFSLITGLLGNRRLLYIMLTAFILFGIISMIDFWRWEYNYGHNLNPNAAIIVPGMAYQPPLIGFKQLLNFGAYSIPDVGGWLFILSGVCMVTATVLEKWTIKQRISNRHLAMGWITIVTTGITSCQIGGPEPIRMNSDKCDHCRMTISDERFGAELVTQKGRAYKFDDLSCLLEYRKNNPTYPYSHILVHDFTGGNKLIDAHSAWFVMSDSLHSPMRGNIAAFASQEDAQNCAVTFGTHSLPWKMIESQYD